MTRKLVCLGLTLWVMSTACGDDSGGLKVGTVADGGMAADATPTPAGPMNPGGAMGHVAKLRNGGIDALASLWRYDARAVEGARNRCCGNAGRFCDICLVDSFA